MNRSPVVSILLPNLNTRKFLDERIDSILKQTLTDWELVIVDNESDDGAWEFFQEIAASDTRIRISQAPRKGMYANWNNCIELARGKYVYIATSDDTMSPQCLERMVDALETYARCDLAHCCLTVIDEEGIPLSKQWSQSEKVRFYGDLINKKHIRRAPYDGYVHAGWYSIYNSITQLLIRRSLFDKVGLFRNDLGSVADFEWEMRAAFVADVIHIPEYLATWRVHKEQATNQNYFNTAGYHRKLITMVESAFRIAQPLQKDLDPKDLSSLEYIYRRKMIGMSWREASSIYQKTLALLQNFMRYPKETAESIISKVSGRKICGLDVDRYLASMLEERHLTNHIAEVS